MAESKQPAAADESVKVVVRVRPLNFTDQGDSACVTCLPKTISVASNKQKEPVTYAFDSVLNACPQAEAFDVCARHLLEAVLQGYNATILAYGQTGSGKTYTMAGAGGAEE